MYNNELGEKLSKNIKDYYELVKKNEYDDKLNKLDNEFNLILSEIINQNKKIKIKDIKLDMFLLLYKNYKKYEMLIDKNLYIYRQKLLYSYFKNLKYFYISKKNYELCIFDGLHNAIITKDKILESICIELLPERINDKSIFELLFYINILNGNIEDAEKYLLKAIKRGTRAKKILEIYQYDLTEGGKDIIMDYFLNKRNKNNNIDEEIFNWFYNENIGISNYHDC